jgi:membrane protein YdbS with pleckstrin-like domain
MANTQPREFYQECLRRAWRGKLFWAEAVSALLALVAIPVGLWILPTAEGHMNWVPLGIFTAVFVATLVVAFFISPYSMYRELETRNNILEKRLFDKEARQEAISRLWK